MRLSKPPGLRNCQFYSAILLVETQECVSTLAMIGYVHKLRFVELTLTYFAWENKLNREANQVIFMGEITCFGMPMLWREKRGNTETEYQYY